MANIGIIGGLGIGKAHAIAAMKLGHTVKWVFDLPDKKYKVKKAYNKDGKGFVCNEWGFIKEEAQQDTEIKSLKKLHVEDVDLVIVATPDLTHEHVVRELVNLFPKCRILVEKPSLLPEVYNEWSSLDVNYSWLNHSKMITPKKYVIMFHQWPPTHRLNNIVTDLGSHLLSVLFNTKLPDSKNKPKLVMSRKNAVIIEYNGVYGIGLYMAQASIKKHKIMDKTLKQWNDEGCDTIIDGNPLLWEDLFGKQIQCSLNKTTKNRKAYCHIDNSLKEFLIEGHNNDTKAFYEAMQLTHYYR